MKQTAVEQMYLEIFAIVIGDIYLNDRTMFKVQNLIEKYREMEKEQMKEWWAKGWNDGHLSTLQENTETFKSE